MGHRRLARAARRRAANREFDGEMSRPDAERLALSDCINWWLTIYPPEPTDDNDGCVHCGTDLGDDGVPVLAGAGHIWLYHGCLPTWMAKRRAEAKKALMAMGIGPEG